MATARKRLTLDIDPNLQRRLKAAAALKGITMRQFCESAFENELKQVIPAGDSEKERRRQAMEDMFALSKEIFGGNKVPGNSADIIREERELRAEQIDNRI